LTRSFERVADVNQTLLFRICREKSENINNKVAEG